MSNVHALLHRVDALVQAVQQGTVPLHAASETAFNPPLTAAAADVGDVVAQTIMQGTDRVVHAAETVAGAAGVTDWRGNPLSRGYAGTLGMPAQRVPMHSHEPVHSHEAVPGLGLRHPPATPLWRNGLHTPNAGGPEAAAHAAYLRAVAVARGAEDERVKQALAAEAQAEANAEAAARVQHKPAVRRRRKRVAKTGAGLKKQTGVLARAKKKRDGSLAPSPPAATPVAPEATLKTAKKKRRAAAAKQVVGRRRQPSSRWGMSAEAKAELAAEQAVDSNDAVRSIAHSDPTQAAARRLRARRRGAEARERAKATTSAEDERKLRLRRVRDAEANAARQRAQAQARQQARARARARARPQSAQPAAAAASSSPSPPLSSSPGRGRQPHSAVRPATPSPTNVHSRRQSPRSTALARSSRSRSPSPHRKRRADSKPSYAKGNTSSNAIAAAASAITATTTTTTTATTRRASTGNILLRRRASTGSTASTASPGNMALRDGINRRDRRGWGSVPSERVGNSKNKATSTRRDPASSATAKNTGRKTATMRDGKHETTSTEAVLQALGMTEADRDWLCLDDADAESEHDSDEFEAYLANDESWRHDFDVAWTAITSLGGTSLKGGIDGAETCAEADDDAVVNAAHSVAVQAAAVDALVGSPNPSPVKAAATCAAVSGGAPSPNSPAAEPAPVARTPASASYSLAFTPAPVTPPSGIDSSPCEGTSATPPSTAALLHSVQHSINCRRLRRSRAALDSPVRSIHLQPQDVSPTSPSLASSPPPGPAPAALHALRLAGGLDLDSPGVHVSSMTATTVNTTRNGVHDRTLNNTIGNRATGAARDGSSAGLAGHTAADAGGDMGEAQIVSLARDLQNLRQQIKRDSDNGRSRTARKSAEAAVAVAAEEPEADPTDLYALNVTYRYK